MQIVHTVTESGAVSNQLFNAAHVYSSLNRKMMEPVDAQGNAKAFALRVQVYSDAANTVTLSTASNSYVTKQAVKSWYKVWRKKFADQGYSLKDLGPYGRHFKPRLEATEDILGSAGEAGRGEWNYSDMVTVPAITGTTGALSAIELIDQYTLSLLGQSTVTSGDGSGGDTRKFDNVGMIDSWLGSRRQMIGNDADNVPESLAIDQDNPLVLARGGDTVSETMLDEVRDLQIDEPPYSHDDFHSAYTQAIIKTNADLTSGADIIAPLGLVKVTTTAACTLVFTLAGIGDM